MKAFARIIAVLLPLMLAAGCDMQTPAHPPMTAGPSFIPLLVHSTPAPTPSWSVVAATPGSDPTAPGPEASPSPQPLATPSPPPPPEPLWLMEMLDALPANLA